MQNGTIEYIKNGVIILIFGNLKNLQHFPNIYLYYHYLYYKTCDILQRFKYKF